MLEKYKPAIILFSILAIIMILIPPVAFIGAVTRDRGYEFLFSINSNHHINTAKLLIQLILALCVSVIFQFIYDKNKAK